MAETQPRAATPKFSPGAGQMVMSVTAARLDSTEQIRTLHQLSDPALSELGLNEFLDELLIRVRDALSVDTVAILLLDKETNELVARAAKGVEEEVERKARIPVGRGFAGRIAAQRVPIFVPDVDNADVFNPILRERGIQSLLGVPLIVQGDLIGVLHVGSLTPRTFDQRDLAVLQLAAARAAPGIERARLFSALEHEHRVAMALQRSLLPRRLVQTPVVNVAARYLAASEEVGGDWYDVFELPGDLIGVTIGDVVGHGIQAAALMGQLRIALHAYAIQGHSPGKTLELVNALIQSLPGEAMATAAYGVFDPDTERLVLASAGHLPPLLVGTADESRVLELRPGAPLGAFPYNRCPELELQLQPGQALVLYTDGLIERPGAPLEQSMQQLLEAVTDRRSPEGICKAAFEVLVPPEGLRDDVAMMVIQPTLIPEELEMRLPADPAALGQVRRALRRWLKHNGADEACTSAAIIAANEACSNAIKHDLTPGPRSFELSATRADDSVTIAVRDSGRWRPPRDGRGKGLAMIGESMDEIEVHTADTGTEVLMRRRLAG